MRLATFRVTDFRCFADSGWINVPDGPLAIVGKNEAGKSAALFALSQMTPQRPDFVPVRDWPRFKRQSERSDTTEVIHCQFALTPSEQAALGEVDVSLGSTTVVTVIRGYDAVRRVSFNGQASVRFTNNLTVALRTLSGDPALGSEVTTAATALLAQASRSIAQLRRLIDSLPLETTMRQQITPFVQEVEAFERRATARTWVVDNLPKFHYFNSYDVIGGEINVADYISRRDGGSSTQGEQLFALACHLSGLSLDDLHALSFEDPRESQERSQLAREASLEITGAIGRIWQQRKGHKSEFHVDGPILRMEVSDEVLDQPVPLDDGSSGFRWFYSFYVLFQAQASGLFKDGILLLDEPGMSLHGRAQQDLVALMRDLSKQNQILYTTHSPFMLANDILDDVAVVEDRVGGSQVAASIWAVDPDNSFPIQYALGFDIAGFNFGLVDQLVVEGVSDYYFIEGLRELLRQRGQADPLRGVGVVPAGGASRVIAQVGTSLGQGHHVRALLDDDTEGRAQRGEILKAKILPDKSIGLLTLPNHAEAAIEDVIGEEHYKSLVRTTYERELTGTAGLRIPSKGTPQVVKRVETGFTTLGLNFSKVRVARKFSDLVRTGTWKASEADIARYSELLITVAGLRSYLRTP